MWEYKVYGRWGGKRVVDRASASSRLTARLKKLETHYKFWF